MHCIIIFLFITCLNEIPASRNDFVQPFYVLKTHIIEEIDQGIFASHLCFYSVVTITRTVPTRCYFILHLFGEFNGISWRSFKQPIKKSFSTLHDKIPRYYVFAVGSCLNAVFVYYRCHFYLNIFFSKSSGMNIITLCLFGLVFSIVISILYINNAFHHSSVLCSIVASSNSLYAQ